MRPSIARKVDNIIEVEVDYYYKDYMKTFPLRAWDADRKLWTVPDSLQAREMLQAIPNIRLGAGLEAPIDVFLPSTGVDFPAVPIRPMPVKITPFEHQIHGYNLGISQPAVALLMEQGCGKSLTAVAIAGRRFIQAEVHRLLIVAPLSVLPVWPREFNDYANFPHRVTSLSGSSTRKINTLTDLIRLEELRGVNELQVVLINYESTWRIEGALQAWRPDMIICDESQRIKTHNSQQSRALHRLGKVAKYRLILTGTPVTNSPLDFWSQYQFLAPGIFPNSFFAFRNTYAVMGGYSGKEIILYKNLGEMANKAHSISYRITKAEALDLPEKIDQTLYCELEQDARRIYNDLARKKVAELSDHDRVTAHEVIVQILRLSQICGGFLRADETEDVTSISKAKLSLLKETVADLLDAGHKVVVFVRFRAEIKAILKIAEQVAGENGYRALWGRTPTEERGPAVVDFQEDPECRILVVNPKTGGLGLTLTGADTVIFYSLDYNYADYAQAKDRIHRIGQSNACTYIHLVARGTIDERVMDALKNKRDMADDLVDNWKSAFENVKEVD